MRYAVTTEEIHKLYAEGLTMQAIADQFGMGVSSVWKRLRAAKIPRRKGGRLRLTRELLVPLVEQGLSLTEISEVVTATPAGVLYRLRTLGLVARDGHQGARRKRREKVYFSGYAMLYRPDHPQADKRGRIMEHRLVMEQTIGRPLRPEEVVHHMNHVRDDNRPENLMLLPNQGAHSRQHHPKGKAIADGNAVRWRKP